MTRKKKITHEAYLKRPHKAVVSPMPLDEVAIVTMPICSLQFQGVYRIMHVRDGE